MDAVKYLKERSRMCKNHTCCSSCPLDEEAGDCRNTEKINPEEAVEIVEKWSAEHSQKTIMQDFLEKFPKARLNNNGVPIICAKNVGYIKVCALSCKECWNRPLEG